MAAQPLARATPTTTTKPSAETRIAPAQKNGELKLLPPHEPATEVLDAVERLAHAAEKAASARFELALHKATTSAKHILAAFGITGGALLVALSAWIFLMVGSALALTPVVGGGPATLIVGGVQAVVAAVLFFVAKKQSAAVKA